MLAPYYLNIRYVFNSPYFISQNLPRETDPLHGSTPLDSQPQQSRIYFKERITWSR